MTSTPPQPASQTNLTPSKPAIKALEPSTPTLSSLPFELQDQILELALPTSPTSGDLAALSDINIRLRCVMRPIISHRLKFSKLKVHALNATREDLRDQMIKKYPAELRRFIIELGENGRLLGEAEREVCVLERWMETRGRRKVAKEKRVLKKEKRVLRKEKRVVKKEKQKKSRY